MQDDDDIFDFQREIFLERQKKFGRREEPPVKETATVRYTPVDTGEACVGG